MRRFQADTAEEGLLSTLRRNQTLAAASIIEKTCDQIFQDCVREFAPDFIAQLRRLHALAAACLRCQISDADLVQEALDMAANENKTTQDI
eukprot:7223577-Lingulodinium_polyedra.AAC.1